MFSLCYLGSLQYDGAWGVRAAFGYEWANPLEAPRGQILLHSYANGLLFDISSRDVVGISLDDTRVGRKPAKVLAACIPETGRGDRLCPQAVFFSQIVKREPRAAVPQDRASGFLSARRQGMGGN